MVFAAGLLVVRGLVAVLPIVRVKHAAVMVAEAAVALVLQMKIALMVRVFLLVLLIVLVNVVG